MEEQRIRQIFVWMISICGFILVFLTPPFAVPDEHAHFINAYCASEMNFFTDVDENITGVGKYVPQYIAEFAQKYRENYATRLDDGYSFSESYFDSWLPVSDNGRGLVFWQSGLVTINPNAYAIAGLGMKIESTFCKMCGGGFDTAYNLMLAGRLANLLFYVLICYWAVCITPCLKRTMMLVMGMPMSIFLGASLSYDAILIPVAMLFFAEIMKLYMDTDDSSIEVKDMVIVALCVFFLVAVKKVCAPFICLLLLVPRAKFKSLKQYIISIGIVVAVGMIAIMPEIISGIVTQEIPETINPNIVAQKEYLFSNLQLIPKIIIDTFKAYSNFYLTGFVGKLGQLDTNFPILYIGIFWIVLLFVAITESCSVKKIDWKVRVATPIVIGIIIIGIFLSMYISHTPTVEEPFGQTVSGVQGRYFIPIFCFLFVVIFNNLKSKISMKIVAEGSKIINNITVFSIIMNSMLTVMIILLRYWCY